jgi:hypothetical protein
MELQRMEPLAVKELAPALPRVFSDPAVAAEIDIPVLLQQTVRALLVLAAATLELVLMQDMVEMESLILEVAEVAVAEMDMKPATELFQRMLATEVQGVQAF